MGVRWLWPLVIIVLAVLAARSVMNADRYGDPVEAVFAVACLFGIWACWSRFRSGATRPPPTTEVDT